MTWDEFLEREGYVGAWVKMRSLKSFQAYYQRWPFDDWATIWPMEGDPRDDIHLQPDERAEGNSQCEYYLSALTPLERRVIELTVEGYKPQDIYKITGTSRVGVRYAKWNARHKLMALQSQ